MKNLMNDLETLGTVPGCSILSIGAVRFDPHLNKLGDEFYVVVNRQSCLDAGLFEMQDTVNWWNKQSAEARKVLDQAGDESQSVPLPLALAQFTDFCKKKPGTLVWGNGADFDNPLLAVAYYRCNMTQGWGPWNGRCYRTFKNLAKHIKPEREGTYHNALDDAKTQARHFMAILNHLQLEVA